MRDIAVIVIGRSSLLCNFLEWHKYKIVYKRYASLYFLTLVDKDDNELTVLELIHHFVEFLDRYFGSVCELDIFLIIIKHIILLKKLLLVAIFKKVIKKNILKNLQLQDSQLQEEKEEDYIIRVKNKIMIDYYLNILNVFYF